METVVLSLPHDRDIDWSAAARAIRDVRLAVVLEVGELYPWEDFDPGAASTFDALRGGQATLHEYACLLRGAMEHGWGEELIALDTLTHRIWVTGGPSWGEPSGDLVRPAVYLAGAGVTDAAGFKEHARDTDTPAGRVLNFDRDEIRRVRFGLAVAHAAEQAAGMDHPGPTASGREWLAAWLAELAPDGCALLRFVGRGLALSAWLKDPASRDLREQFDERARALAQVADEGALEVQPRWQSLWAASGHCRRLVDDIAEWFEVLDDLERWQDDEGVQAFIEEAGGTLGDALEIEVAAHALFAATVALADLGGDDVGALVDAPASSIVSRRPPESQRRIARLDQYLALLVVQTVDWLAGEHAVEAMNPAVRGERQADLAELKRLVTVSEYRRFATAQRVADARLFVAAPHFADGPDVAVSIARLARDGILAAAGIRCWSAPDPDFNGPVETFVAGDGTPRDDQRAETAGGEQPSAE